MLTGIVLCCVLCVVFCYVSSEVRWFEFKLLQGCMMLAVVLRCCAVCGSCMPAAVCLCVQHLKHHMLWFCWWTLGTWAYRTLLCTMPCHTFTMSFFSNKKGPAECVTRHCVGCELLATWPESSLKHLHSPVCAPDGEYLVGRSIFSQLSLELTVFLAAALSSRVAPSTHSSYLMFAAVAAFALQTPFLLPASSIFGLGGFGTAGASAAQQSCPQHPF
jgi:hypothetical protein